MLPNKTEFKQSGTLDGEDITMSFDENSLDFLAGVLTDLYSDKELAVIREYSTNARDSHVAAGQTRPIEVFTPTALSYNFKVRDYGLGLSKDDIYNIYSKYGASTKRETNAQTGMLGLGCKSALTYSDQFSIISVKDAIKIMVNVSRSESGGGQMTIVYEKETDEPNGVEIVVPVGRNNDFKFKTKEFFKYWDESEVIIDGKPPVQLNLKRVTDKIYLKEDPGYYEKSWLVMGGVPYEINQEKIRLPKGFVAFVDIGAVAFTPSREHLRYTQKTLEVLNALHEEYKVNIMKAIQAELDSYENKFELAKCFYKWKKTLDFQNIKIIETDFNYRGESLKITASFDAKWQNGRQFSHISHGKWGLTDLTIDSVEYSTLVIDFDVDKLTSYQKRKLNYWADKNGQSNTFYFCKKLDKDSWISGMSQVSWTDILAIKIPRTSTSKKNETPTYEVFVDDKTISVEKLDKTRPIFYSTKSEWRDVWEVCHSFSKWFKDIQFAFVGQNRLKKFMTLYPNAVPMKTGIHNYIENYVNSLTNKETEMISSDSYERARFKSLDPLRVVDPQLRYLVESSGKTDEISKLQYKWDDMCRLSWKTGYKIKEIERGKTPQWVYDRYHLLGAIINNRTHYPEYADHIYLYINTVYQQMLNNEEQNAI